MMQILPSPIRTVVFLDLRDYPLPASYLPSDLSDVLEALPVQAYSSGFALNMENLTSSLVVLFLPDKFSLDESRVKLPYSHNFEFVIEHVDSTSESREKYSQFFKSKMQGVGESEKFSDCLLSLHPVAVKHGIEGGPLPLEHHVDQFLAMCGSLKLNRVIPEVNNSKSKAFAAANLRYVARILRVDTDILDLTLVDFITDVAIDMRSLITYYGMALKLHRAKNLPVVDLEDFQQHYSKGRNLCLSEDNTNIGCLIAHSIRTQSIAQHGIENCYKLGRSGIHESTYDSLISLLRHVRTRKRSVKIDLTEFPSIHMELMVTAGVENHNTVRHYLVSNQYLPKADRIDADGCSRYDSSKYNLNQVQSMIFAAALGIDSKAKLVYMH